MELPVNTTHMAAQHKGAVFDRRRKLVGVIGILCESEEFTELNIQKEIS